MICQYPKVKDHDIDGQSVEYRFGCGQCMACRINRQRKKSARIIMEMLVQEYSAMTTLTYEPDKVPLTDNGHPTLVKRHMQLYMKRLRTNLKDRAGKLRYLTVGEYGSKSGRPHYHQALFGVPLEIIEEEIDKAWGQGFIHAGEINKKTASYISKYTVKHETTAKYFPKGVQPEFCLQSTRPAIGYDYMIAIADSLKRRGMGVEGFPQTLEGEIYFEHELPSVFRYDKRLWPLDRYAKQVILDRMGGDHRDKLQKAIQHMQRIQQEDTTLHSPEMVKRLRDDYYREKLKKLQFARSQSRSVL